MDCTSWVSSESQRGRFSSLQSHSWWLIFNLSLNNTSHTTCEFSPDLWTQDVLSIALAPRSQGIGPMHSPAPMSPDLVHTTLPHRPRSSSAQPSKTFSSAPTLVTVCCHIKEQTQSQRAMMKVILYSKPWLVYLSPHLVQCKGRLCSSLGWDELQAPLNGSPAWQEGQES